MTPKITIISVFGHRNKGDAAIFASLLACLEEIFPGAQVSAVVRHPETESRLYPGVRIEEQLLRSVARNGIAKGAEMAWFAFGCMVWLLSSTLARPLLPRRKRRSLEAIAAGDLILSCGGGFLHDGFRGFVVHLFEMHVVTRLGKPLLLVSQSIGPFRASWARRLARSVLDRCDAILPRERLSLTYLRENLRVSKPSISLIPDLAFRPAPHHGRKPAAPPAAEVELASGGGRTLGVTVRHWNFPGRAAQAEALNTSFQRALADLLGWLIESRGFHVVFFPQAITADFGDLDDRSVARRVAAHLDAAKVTLIEDDLPVPHLRELIGRCDLFVGTRMHSNIFALSAGVPTLAIAYLPKTKGIMESVGLGEHVVAMDAGGATFREAFEKLERNQDEVREHLRQEIPRAQASIATKLSDAISQVFPFE